MKKILFFTILFISIFIHETQADMIYYKLAEICQTQISFDAEINISDSRYIDLEDYPITLSQAISQFLTSDNTHVGQIFDCEDIALNAKIRFIIAMREGLIPQGKIFGGVPIGTIIFENDFDGHVVNVLIYHREAIIYDIGRQQIWTPTDIENAGYEITKINF